jgi:hypothetical protein
LAHDSLYLLALHFGYLLDYLLQGNLKRYEKALGDDEMPFKSVMCILIFAILGSVSCKPRRDQDLARLAADTAAVDPANQDAVGNALAQTFAEIYAKHKGDLSAAAKDIQADGQIGQEVKNLLLKKIEMLRGASARKDIDIDFFLSLEDADKELQFISNILADTKFKENADLVKFVKDNQPIFCVYELAANNWDIERTCIDVTRIAAEIYGAVKSGAFFNDKNIMQTIKARVVYKELVDFDKIGKVWEGKSADEVYAWSKSKLAGLPIENSAIRLVGEAISLRNAWIRAMTIGDEAAAIRYEEKMRDLRNHSPDQRRVIEYSNVDNRESLVTRLIRIYNMSETELKQRVKNYEEAQKPWWVFW